MRRQAASRRSAHAPDRRGRSATPPPISSTRLAAALAPLEALSATPRSRSPTLADAHRAGHRRRCRRARRGDAGGLRRRRRRGARPRPSTRSPTTRRPPSRSRRRDYPDLFRAIVADRVVRRPGRPGVRVRIYGLLEARLQSDRPRRARRAGRRRLAAGDAQRSLAQPADAARARPRPAGAAHLALRARLRADARRRARWCCAYPAKLAGRADGALALRAAAGGGRGRGALEAALRARRALSRLGARRSTGRASRSAGHAAGAEAAARDARPTSLSVTEIENWLRDPYSIYAKHILRLRAARSDRHAAGRARPRHRHPRRDRTISPRTSRTRLPDDPVGELIELGERAFRRARGFSGGARVLVAALPAHRALVRRLGSARAAPASPAHQRRDRRQDSRFRSASARSRCARAPTASSICATAATRSSTTRPARLPTEPQVRIGLSPQLTLEGAILRARRISTASPPAGRSPSSSTCR